MNPPELLSQNDRFKDRTQAGRELALKLHHYHAHSNALVLALPRGGVPVAHEVASRRQLPLDVFIVRKLGMPRQPELAMGAIASGGIQVINDDVIKELHIPNSIVSQVAEKEREELERREKGYRGSRAVRDVANKVVILVDDGLATGSTMRAAIAALRVKRPVRIVVAVPVASGEAFRVIQREADELVCLKVPQRFFAVGTWYEDFSQVSDDEVCKLLRHSDCS